MRILFADDHPLFREGVKPLLRKLADRVHIVEAEDYPAAFDAAGRYDGIDLALLDLFMPGMAGVDGASRFRAAFPHIPMVVLSAAEEREDIRRILANGAAGYLCKSAPSDVIVNALRLVLAGGIYVPPALLAEGDKDGFAVFGEDAGNPLSLTPRQIDVLREVIKGQSNRQIAHTLNITEGTIKVHMQTIFRILNVTNRTEAVLVAQKMGFGPPK